jgi:hypothetical protein
MTKEIKYKPYFYINGVGIHHKSWSKENSTMFFFTEDLKLQMSIHDCQSNYPWPKCIKLFGDSK